MNIDPAEYTNALKEAEKATVELRVKRYAAHEGAAVGNRKHRRYMKKLAKRKSRERDHCI